MVSGKKMPNIPNAVMSVIALPAEKFRILKSSSFLGNFKNEKWGRYILNADDDNFVTRWLVAHQWKTWIQYHDECEIETTLENSSKFLYQCSRWARSNWRSNWTSLVHEKYVLTCVASFSLFRNFC